MQKHIYVCVKRVPVHLTATEPMPNVRSWT